MQFKKIRNKIIFYILALGLTLALVRQAVDIISFKNTLANQSQAVMATSLEGAEDEVAARLQQNFFILEAMASMPFVRDTETPLAERATALNDFIEDNEEAGLQACAVTDVSGTAVLSFGKEIDVSIDDYFQEAIQGENVVSDPFISRATGNLHIVYAVPYYDAAGEIAGVITLNVDAYSLSSDFNLQGLGETGKVFILAQDGTVVASSDAQQVSEQQNAIELAETDDAHTEFAGVAAKMTAGKSGFGEYRLNNTKNLVAYSPVEGTDWSIAVTQDKSEANAAVNTFIVSGIISLVVVAIVSIVAGALVARSISSPITNLAAAANQLAEGRVDVEVAVNTKDETGELALAFAAIAENVQKQAAILTRIADGDFTTLAAVRGDDDIINQAINNLVERNNHLLLEIRTAASQVAVGASQIATGSQVLATGSTEQAATMEEFSAALEEVRGHAITSTKLAANTEQDIVKTETLTQQSLHAMKQMTEAMQIIESSSQEIASVIGVIDSIAFQTNILALNASVEAAHAGEHGRGFAVVADEIRELASKSADAASETAALIQTSIAHVNEGVEMVGSVSAGIGQISDISKENAASMAQITGATEHQDESINELNDGITQLTDVVQANSATAEQSAASAQQLNAQSVLLNEIVDGFKLRNDSADAFLDSALQEDALTDDRETAVAEDTFQPSQKDDIIF